LRQFAELRTILLISRGDQQGQQVAQSIDRRMHFAAKAMLGSIIASTASTYRCLLQGPAIQDGRRRGLPVAFFGFSQQQTQVVDEGCKAACCYSINERY